MKRSELHNEVFGIPQERKYPMPDKKHTESAIKLFNHVDPKYEEQLAKKVIANMKKYDIDPKMVGKNNRLRKYLPKDMVNEAVFKNKDDIYYNKDKFDSGEINICFIIGLSGSGKSTLIKLILKEEEPTSGHIIINGKDTTFLKPKRVPYLRRSMGVVFQDFRLLPDKTVYDNVAYAMYIVRATPRHIRRQVPMVLSLVGLSGKAKMYPNELSGGEQQRVAIARALVNHPVLLLADEPTGNLDPVTAREIMELLSEINKKGTTVLVVTHNRELVNEMGKRVIQIEDGQIQQDEARGFYDI